FREIAEEAHRAPPEDHVDDQRGRHGAILARGYSWRGRPLDSVLREGQENGQEAAQHQEQLVRLLRAEFGYGPSCLVAVGHFAPPPGVPADKGSCRTSLP